MITPRAFNNLLKGWRKKDEALMRERWEMHREVIVTISRPNLKKIHASKPKEKLYELPWDKEVPAKETLKEELSPADFWQNLDKKTKTDS